MALAGVEVGSIVGITEEKHGNEANRRVGDVKGVFEHEGARGRAKADGADAEGIHRRVAKSFNGVRGDGLKGMEIRKNGGNVASGTSVNDEGKGRRRGRGRKRRSRKRSRKRRRESEKGLGMVLIIIFIRARPNFRNVRRVRDRRFPGGVRYIGEPIDKDGTRRGRRHRRRGRRRGFGRRQRGGDMCCVRGTLRARLLYIIVLRAVAGRALGSLGIFNGTSRHLTPRGNAEVR